jgi:hypothetical protein
VLATCSPVALKSRIVIDRPLVARALDTFGRRISIVVASEKNRSTCGPKLKALVIIATIFSNLAFPNDFSVCTYSFEWDSRVYAMSRPMILYYIASIRYSLEDYELQTRDRRLLCQCFAFGFTSFFPSVSFLKVQPYQCLPYIRSVNCTWQTWGAGTCPLPWRAFRTSDGNFIRQIARFSQKQSKREEVFALAKI